MSFAKQAAADVWRNQGLDPEETMWGYTQDEYADHLMKTMEPVQLTLHTCMIDCGDGSAYPALFKTAKGAEAREDYEVNVCGYAFCSATGSISVDVDPEGNAVGKKGLDYIRMNEEYEEIYED